MKSLGRAKGDLSLIEKLLEGHQLKRREWSLESKYFLCLVEEKMMDHLLLHSEMTQVL